MNVRNLIFRASNIISFGSLDSRFRGNDSFASGIIRAGLVCLVLLGAPGWIGAAESGPDYSLFDPLVDVCDLIHRHYVSEIEDEEILSGAINGMLHQLDPYSEYIPPTKVAEFQKQASGSYEGIGVSIDSKDDHLTVISPFEGSPAYEAGVIAGDRIIEVNGEDTKNWSVTRAVEKLTGEADTEVEIKVLHRDGQEETVTITRGQIHVPTVMGWRRNEVDGAWDYFLDDDAKIGYLRLTQFASETVEEFDKVMEQMLESDLQALVLDLRNNPGGILTAALRVADRFVEEGVLVSTRGANSPRQTQRAHSEGTLRRFHVVVLINQGSASASEIVAGALQDHHRAVIVGMRSWGKGSVQRIIRLLDSGAALKLTTDYYYLPKGRCLHRLPGAEAWGVDPDIEEELAGDETQGSAEDYEELKRKKIAKLRKLMAKLTAAPRAAVKIGELADDPSELVKLWEVDRETKKKLLQRLLHLDNQLAQGVKQCKGLLRTHPTLKGLAEAFEESD